MNTPLSASPVERKRKQVIQLCKSIIKYMEVQDGREKIDSLLDTMLDRVAEVSVVMHDYWVRGMEERMIYERGLEQKAHVRRHARTVDIASREQNNLALMLHTLKKSNPAEFQRLMGDALGDEIEEVEEAKDAEGL